MKLPMWLGVAIAVPVVCATLYVALPLSLFALMAHDVRDISEVKIGDLARDAGVQIPPDARLTHFTEKPPIDPIWLARIVMSKSAVTKLSQSIAAYRPIDGRVVGAISESTPWWKPRNIVLQRRYYSESNAVVHVVVSEEDGQVAVYIEHAIY